MASALASSPGRRSRSASASASSRFAVERALHVAPVVGHVGQVETDRDARPRVVAVGERVLEMGDRVDEPILLAADAAEERAAPGRARGRSRRRRARSSTHARARARGRRHGRRARPPGSRRRRRAAPSSAGVSRAACSCSSAAASGARAAARGSPPRPAPAPPSSSGSRPRPARGDVRAAPGRRHQRSRGAAWVVAARARRRRRLDGGGEQRMRERDASAAELDDAVRARRARARRRLRPRRPTPRARSATVGSHRRGSELQHARAREAGRRSSRRATRLASVSGTGIGSPGPGRASASIERARQLDGEERIAARRLGDAPQGRPREDLLEVRPDHVMQSARAERAETPAHEPRPRTRASSPIGSRAGLVASSRAVVITPTRPIADPAQRERQRRRRGPIEPLLVVDREHDRRVASAVVTDGAGLGARADDRRVVRRIGVLVERGAGRGLAGSDAFGEGSAKR